MSEQKKKPYVTPEILTEVTASVWPAHAQCSAGQIIAPSGNCVPGFGIPG